MLLTRMQANKTDKFVYLFTRFILYTMAINKEGFTPDQIVGAIEQIQSGFVILYTRYHQYQVFFFSPRLWSDILNNFVILEAPKFPPKDRKLAAIGLTRLICESTFMLQEPLVRSWYVNFFSIKSPDARLSFNLGLRLTLPLESSLANASILRLKRKKPQMKR